MLYEYVTQSRFVLHLSFTNVELCTYHVSHIKMQFSICPKVYLNFSYANNNSVEISGIKKMSTSGVDPECFHDFDTWRQ